MKLRDQKTARMNAGEEELYAKAAQEIAANEYFPGLKAKAVADADGDEKRALALYIKMRVSQLKEEQDSELSRRQRAHQEASLIQKRQTAGKLTLQEYRCEYCGYEGLLNVCDRGSDILFLLLLLLGVVPGIIYGISMNGTKAVCPKCKSVVVEPLVEH